MTYHPSFPLNLLLSPLSFSLIRHRYDGVIVYHRSTPLQFFFNLFTRSVFSFSKGARLYLTDHLPFSPLKNRTLQYVQLTRLTQLKLIDPESLDFYFPLSFHPPSIPFHGSRYITVNVGGGNIHSSALNRLYPLDSYIQVIEQLPLPIVLLGNGPSDFHRCSKIANHFDNNSMILNFCSKLTFSETAFLISKSTLYFGNDSSLLFLASALGIKCLGIYGPTSPLSAAPLGLSASSSSFHYCSPCYNPCDSLSGMMYRCPDNICLSTLEPHNIVHTILNLLRDS